MKKYILILSILFCAFVVCTSFLAPPGEQLWRFITGGRIRSQPAVGYNGIVYAISEDRYLYALNSEGVSLWRSDLKERVSDCFTIGYDGSIYIGLKNGIIIALNPHGKIIWKFNTKEPLKYSPALHGDGTLYFITDQGTIFALSHTGTACWKKNLDLCPSGSPVADADGTLYIPLNDQKLSALYPWGEEKWQLSLKGNPRTPAIAADGTLVLGTDLGNLYTIHPNGRILWSFTFNTEVLSPIIGRNGTIYGTLKNGQVFCIDKHGELLWIVSVGAALSRSCVIGSSGTLYVSADENHLSALSPSGTVLWSQQIQGEMTDLMLSRQGILYAGSSDWSLYAFKAETAMASPWPQYQHDALHSGQSSRKLARVSIEDLYGNNPDYLYFKNLLLSFNPYLMQKGLDEIQQRYDALAITSSRNYLFFLLGKVAGISITEIDKYYNYPEDGYSRIREQACRLYTLLGGFYARDLLLHLIEDEKEMSMKAVAIRCLGILQSDPEGSAVNHMASLILSGRGNTPDNSLARDITHTLRNIAYYNGALPASGIKTLLTISQGHYLKNVKEQALTVLQEIQ
ncbi:MAG: PQQ-binding-like beta-propeller repeat protein [Spirochaetales bacterium]|nr:PQQ-binding-like beta-propeller repeat protein [Spirochaetales bacterium]